jgi:peroxiredoxin
MNERLLKEHRQAVWLVLVGGVLAILVFSFPLLLRKQAEGQAVAVSPTLTAAQTGEVILTRPSPTPPPTANPYFISSVTAGQPAPNFTLKTLTGNSITLSDLRGKPVILNFWASWCYPCRLEMPELERVYQKYPSDGLTVLGINVTTQDTLADAQAFVAEFAPTFPILLDDTGEATTRYGVRGLPTSYFINRQGIVTHVHLGALNARQLGEFAGEILAGN